jgi:exopolysaccharide biosynthesis polyprenyl glycosylphosphotransferase
MLGADLTAVAVSVLLAGTTAALLAAVGALTLTLMWSSGLYRPRLELSALDVLPALLGRTLVAVGAAALASFLLRQPSATLTADFARASLLLLLALPLGRAVAYWVVRTCRRRRWVAHRTLIAGGGTVAARLAQALTAHPEYGLEPVAFLDPHPLPKTGPTLPSLSPTLVLADAIRQLDVKVVIVAYGSVPETTMVHVLRTCDRLDCEIFMVPRLFDVGGLGQAGEHVWGIPLHRIRRPAFRRTARATKRTLDVAVSATALLALAPLMAVLAVLVRFGVGGPVLFRQERLGADGRSFLILKFRSLTPVGDESATRWSVGTEPSIGAVGRFLRRSSLDELPQFWNVLRGEMSLVGPRPERPYFADRFTQMYPHYAARQRMRSGLTGWAQVHGLRGDTSIDDRARFDNAYIDEWSLWGDLKILAWTAAQVVWARGA